MSGTSVIKQVPGKEVREELRSFISTVNMPPTGSNQTELMRKALGLLKTLPASRDAVFQYLTTVYEKALIEQLVVIEDKTKESIFTESPVLTELHTFLEAFVTSSTNTWALVISKWTLELLGMFSNKYSNRGRCPVNGTLGDSLNQWMSCQATRSLMDINIKCLSSVINTRHEATAIYNLLDTCVVHIPHFDWGVANVGLHYPYILTKRVITWGLQDLLANDAVASFKQDSLSVLFQRPKMISLVGILTHLAGSFSHHIETLMTHLVKWSLDEESDYRDLTLDKGGAVPFLLQLASVSGPLLAAFSQGPLSTLTQEELSKYIRFGERWCRLAGGRQAMLSLVVHVIFSTEDSSQQILDLLFTTIGSTSTQTSDWVLENLARELLELILKDVELASRANAQKVPLLQSLNKKINWVLSLLLSEPDGPSQHTAITLISLLGRNQVSALSKAVAYVLLRSENDDHLSAIVRLSEVVSGSAVLSSAVSFCLNGSIIVDPEEYVKPSVLWTNFSKLLKWEASATLVSLPMKEALRENLSFISEELCKTRDAKAAGLIADVVVRTLSDSVTLGSNKLYLRPSTVQQTLSLVQATISYFYLLLTQSEDVEQVLGMRLVTNLITKLCENSSCARTMVIRELLESALFRSPSLLFGAARHSPSDITYSSVSLLSENYKQGTSSLLAQRHSCVLHAGVIESYKRKYGSEQGLPEDKVVHNTHLLICAVRAACASESHQAFLDSVVSIALLLVELISPDVMYNGLPWPEEEFCKVTVERDLFIRRMLDQSPLVWSLLSYIAYYRPALCYCSVILRAVVATLIGQWSTAGQQGRLAGHCTQLITSTSRILHVMTLGQLLPPPLTAISQVIPHLEPFQVVEVLKECVWNYMRDHVPSPALFTRDPNGAMWRDPVTSRPAKPYTEPLRLAVLANISILGNLYNTLFVPDTIDEE